MMFERLSAEFPRAAISWRAQSVTADGSKALALAYIDARDVMDRLDEVCGPDNWQDRYEFHGARTICYLSIRVNNEWITKADGAGDSDVEAEKGAISDALKRSAVKWGIGRYLYHIVSPWVPCETSDFKGKKQWKKWTADPWNFVKGSKQVTPNASAPMDAARAEAVESLWAELVNIRTAEGLKSFWMDNYKQLKSIGPAVEARFTEKKNELKAAFDKPKNTVQQIQDEFPGARVVRDEDMFPGDMPPFTDAEVRQHPINGG